MTHLNSSTPKWIALVVSVAIAGVGFAYGIGAKGVDKVETRLDSVGIRLRVVEQDSASLTVLVATELRATKEDIEEMKLDLREIKRLLMEQ